LEASEVEIDYSNFLARTTVQRKKIKKALITHQNCITLLGNKKVGFTCRTALQMPRLFVRKKVCGCYS